MKKTYIEPAIQTNEAQVSTMMAISLKDGAADSSKDVLTKEDNAWDIWDEE